MDLSSPGSIAKLKTKPGEVVIKEGAEYAVEVEFKVSGGLCSGLKYLQVAKRGGIKVDKIEEMIGSYGPSEVPVVKRFPPEEAPSGKFVYQSRVENP
jgi:Rho GDP-dissociation inhibitor